MLEPLQNAAQRANIHVDRTIARAIHAPLRGFLALVTLRIEAVDRLRMTVSPTYAFAPAVLKVQIRIDPNAENRSLEVIADSGGFYRSSEIQLEGERSPAAISIDVRDVPEGDYQVLAILRDGAGHERSMVFKDVKILGATM